MSDPRHEIVAVVEHSTPAAPVHPVVAAALAQSPDPATLRELLAVQREWEAGEARRAYTRAIVALKADLPSSIARDVTVAYMSAKGPVRYTHASLAAALDAVTPHLTRHGFAISWTPSTDRGAVTVTCRLTHAAGHHEEATISAPVDTSGSKSTAQGTASTITLLQRYTALSLLGIATADMRDPTGPAASPDGIDTARNLRAAAAVRRAGRSIDDARDRAGGRGPEEWTAADLDAIRAWLRPPTDREPGEVES